MQAAQGQLHALVIRTHVRRLGANSALEVVDHRHQPFQQSRLASGSRLGKLFLRAAAEVDELCLAAQRLILQPFDLRARHLQLVLQLLTRQVLQVEFAVPDFTISVTCVVKLPGLERREYDRQAAP